MEFNFVSVEGIFFKQIMQKSTSSSEDSGLANGFEHLKDFRVGSAGHGCFDFSATFFITFRAGNLLPCSSRSRFLSFKTAIFSGDVRTQLCIGFRPLLLFFVALFFCNGLTSNNTSDKFEEGTSLEISGFGEEIS